MPIVVGKSLLSAYTDSYSTATSVTRGEATALTAPKAKRYWTHSPLIDRGGAF